MGSFPIRRAGLAVLLVGAFVWARSPLPIGRGNEPNGTAQAASGGNRLSQVEQFDRQVTLAPSRLTVLSVLERVSAATNVPVLLSSQANAQTTRQLALVPAGYPAVQPTIAAFSRTPAIDVLRAVEAVTGYEWLPVGQTWVLALDSKSARLALLTPADRKRIHVKIGRAFRSFSPRQGRLLAARRWLLPSDLSVAQRAALRTVSAMHAAAGSTVAPRAAKLDGVYVLLGSTKDSVSGRIEHESRIMLPTRSGASRLIASIPVGQLELPPPDLSSLVRLRQFTALAPNLCLNQRSHSSVEDRLDNNKDSNSRCRSRAAL